MSRQALVDTLTLAKELNELYTHAKRVMKFANEKSQEYDDPESRPFTQTVLAVHSTLTPIAKELVRFAELAMMLGEEIGGDAKKQGTALHGQMLYELQMLKNSDKIRKDFGI